MSNKDHQQSYRDRMREKGLVPKLVWIRPENKEYLKRIENNLREEGIKIYTAFGRDGYYGLPSELYMSNGGSVLCTMEDNQIDIVSFT